MKTKTTKMIGMIVCLSLLLAVAAVSGWAQDTPNANTIALYHLNGNLNDASSNGYTGTETGPGTFGWGTGVYGEALQTTGGGFTANIVGAQDNGNGITVDGWFDLASMPGDVYYLLGANGGNLFSARVNPDGSVWYGVEMTSGWITNTTAPGTMAVGQWDHLEFVSQNDNTQFYVNGTAEGLLTGATVSMTQLTVGVTPWAPTYTGDVFAGSIDEVRVEEDVVPVPEPGSLLALGTALIAFCGVYRRRLS